MNEVEKDSPGPAKDYHQDGAHSIFAKFPAATPHLLQVESEAVADVLESVNVVRVPIGL